MTSESLVVDSWNKVKAIPNYENVAGELLFRRIFELNPGATSLFSFAQGHRADDEELFQNVLFKKHASAVVSTVTAAISLLEKKEMETLVIVLKDLGGRHAALGLEKAHYELVGESLLFTLEKALGADFSKSVKDAWSGIYGVITEQMMLGAKELSHKIVEEEKETEEKLQAELLITQSYQLTAKAANADPKIAEQNRKIAEEKNKFEEKVAKQKERELRRQRELTEDEVKANQIAASLITNSYSLTEVKAYADPKIADQNRQIEAQKKAYEVQKVVESWNKVKAIPKYENVVGEILFQRIFESNPDATALFQFAQGHAADDLEMYNSELFVKHSTAVVSTVTAAVGLLEKGDMETLMSVLKDLGERHGSFELVQAHYDLVGESLLYTLAKGLGDTFTSDMKTAWIGVYTIIAQQMMNGARDYSRKKAEEEKEAEEKLQAALLITKSYNLTELAANNDPKIAEENRKINEQKQVFDAKLAKKKERELKRQQEPSEDEIKANQEAADRISKSYSLTELSANADPQIAEQNRLIEQQKKAFEAERLKAEEENKSSQEVVVESWEKVKAIQDYQKVAGELLFRKIFELNPGATSFFSFANGHKASDEELYQTVSFIKHATSVVSTVTAAVGLLEKGEMEVLVTVLKDLGARHATLELEKAHYDLVGQALLSTLGTALGDAFTPKVEASWIEIYAVITEQMMLGAKDFTIAKEKEPRTSEIQSVKQVQASVPAVKRLESRGASVEKEEEAGPNRSIQMGYFKFWGLMFMVGLGGYLIGLNQQQRSDPVSGVVKDLVNSSMDPVSGVVKDLVNSPMV